VSDVPTAKYAPNGVELLPPLYQRWVEELLAGPIPAETEATCQSCAMCSTDAPRGDAEHFDPRIKCCTYLPTLASYLVGRVLLDHTPEAARGRASVVARIEKRVGVTPLGLLKPRTYQLLYREGGTASFGRSGRLACPHYLGDEGKCGVWRHRESMCATWFCKHVRGLTGMRFWREAMHPLFSSVERALSKWCLVELDVGGDAILRNLQPARDDATAGREIDDVVDDGGYAALWGNWLGREALYYEACAHKVDALAWKEVVAIGGAEVAAWAEGARASYAKLTGDALPKRVRPAELHVVKSDRDLVRLRAYSPFDPIELPRAILDVLPALEGDTREALAKLAANGVDVDEDLVRQLVDFGVVEDAG
jgi:hypothetical protein